MKIKKFLACLMAVGSILGFAPNMHAVKLTYNDVKGLIEKDEFFSEWVPQRDLACKSKTLSEFLPILEACRGIKYKFISKYLESISMDSYYYDLDRYFDYIDWRAAQNVYLYGITFDFDRHEREHPFNRDEWLAVQMEISVLIDFSANYDELMHNLRQLIEVYSSTSMQEYYKKHLFIEES